MSLRGFFSRKTDSHRRRKTATALSAFAAQAEFLEDRVLLSVENPLLTNHGVTFENTNVIGPNVQFFSINNVKYSNNNGVTFGRGNGSGLFINLDGTQPFGTPNAPQVPAVQSITYSSSGGNLVFSNNSSAGSSINLKNMTLDTLIIDSSQFTFNQRAGLIINLTNAQIRSIVIVNSTFANNANDGLCIIGTNSSVENIQVTGNAFTGNQQNDGILIQFTNSRLGVVNVANNQMLGNGGSGIHVDLNNTSVSSLNINQNVMDNNAQNAAFLDLEDSDVRGTVTLNTLTNSRIGDGLRIVTRRAVMPNGMVGGGLRNLDLDSIRGNNMSNNAGFGLNADLGQNTTFGAAITLNTVNNNNRAGVNILAKDTTNAFDVQIGGETVDPQTQTNLDVNTINGNRGAGIAISLDDTSDQIGNTSGRFRILNNLITNTADDNNLSTQFAGEGIFVRARGSVALVNGAARILNSRIDGNSISGNASHGMAFDISEDSEAIDLLIGDAFNPNDPNEGLEGNGRFVQGLFIRNSGNLVTNNGGDGLNFLRRDAALVQGVRILDNLFDNNNSGINYVVRNDNNVVNSVTIQHNDITNNRTSGLQFSTQIDAALVATVDNNLISGNNGDGIFTIGVESDASDAETFGGTITRNTIQGNSGKGINVNSIVGDVAPLTIGLLGFDPQGRSLGNLIDTNGDDGIEINSFGFIDVINNIITANGQNNVARNVHGDGKGIDINLNDFDATLPRNGILSTGALSANIISNIIQGNLGDGMELIARADETLDFSAVLNVTAYSNIIDLNLGRGVDVLNGGDAETYVIFGDGTTGTGSRQNIIRSNGLEGFYAVNTPSVNQTQDVDATSAAAILADINLGNGFQRTYTPNLTMDINGNQIQQNGLPTNPGQLNGSGLVIRVGTSGSDLGSEFTSSDIPDYDGFNLFGFNSNSIFNAVGSSNSATDGNGRVNARVDNNTFGGNFGVDVLAESFRATMDPQTTGGTWNGTTYDIPNNGYTSDPLARLNLEFINNTGEAVDLVRVGAFYNNAEGTFKSRTSGRTPPDPQGPFGGSAGRFRNSQRLPGRGVPFDSPDFGFGGLFSGMGMGTSGVLSSITPGGPNTPITVTSFGPHGLFSGDVVLLDSSSFSAFFSGFTIDNLFEVTVIDAFTFALNDTEGETDIFDFFPGMDFTQVTFDDALLYPGVGPSTFRIIEVGNNFTQGNDFTLGNESAISRPGGGNGHLPYTYDREQEGTFNFRTLTTSNATVAEGGIARFDITLSQALDVPLEIFYHTEFGGSATPDVDFTSVPFLTSVILPAGQTTVSVFIQTTQDTTFEQSEIFRFLTDGALATIIDPTDPFFGSYTELYATPTNPVAIGTILDNDTLPVISISDAGGFEMGFGGVGTMTFTVTLSNASNTPVFVDFSTQDFTANVDVDYRAREGTLTFAPGETTKQIVIEILSDSLFPTPGSDAPQETLFVNLTSPQGVRTDVGDFQGLGTIFDARFVNISDAFANGDGNAPGTSLARFMVTLTDANGNPAPVPSGQTITINYNTQDGTATVADGDYNQVINGTLVFSEFESSKFLFVTVNQDRIFEGDERFQVTITSPQGTIQDGTAVGSILENLEVASTRDASGQALVEVFNLRTNTVRFSMNPYPGFAGEVRVATADFNGDGIADIVTAPGPGGGPNIRVLNGANGAPLADFMAYDASFAGGVFVATGDINGDGRDDIITGPDQGGGPHIRVFDVSVGFQSFTVTVVENFLAGTVLGPNFAGGVRVASGNVDGDLLGRDDIILGFGPGSRPLVEVYTGDGFAVTPPNLFRQFDAYDPMFQGGVYVSAADIGGGAGNAPDGFADIITGAGAGGGPHVIVFSGGNTLKVLESFFAYGAQFAVGVRVASGDVANDPNGITSRDRISEIITAPGPGGGPHVRAFSVDGVLDLNLFPPAVLNQFAFASNLTSGVFIAGRNRNQVGEGSPLLLDASALSESGTAPELTYAELAPVVEAAFNRLSAAGVNPYALDQLRQIQFVITDLSGATLGLQTAGRILIDRTAAGRGYFVDLTPGLDEEFSNQSGRLIASDAAATGRVDLLTVLLHELEHALGEEHVTTGGSHLLAPTILPGERRLPEHDEVFSGGDIFESLLDLN